MEMTMQLASGKYIRQFFEPNSKSPGSLKKPILPSAKNNKPAATIINPRKTNHLPICWGPKSILRLSINRLKTYHKFDRPVNTPNPPLIKRCA